jgi:hypothetical protein
MEQKNVGDVVVIERDRPADIPTDRDLALATCVNGLSRHDGVAAVTSRPVSTIHKDTRCNKANDGQSVSRLPLTVTNVLSESLPPAIKFHFRAEQHS